MDKPATSRTGSLAAALANTGWLLGSSGVSAVLSLVYIAILTRTLGPAGFGQFALVTGIAGAVAAIVSFQTWQIVIRYGTEHLHDGRELELRTLLKACVALDLVGGAAGVLLAWLAVAALGPSFGWSGDLQRDALLYCAAILLAVRSTPIGILRLHDRYAAAAGAESMLPIARLIGALAAAALSPDLRTFLFVWGASEVVTAIIYWVLVARSKVLRLGGGIPSASKVREQNPGILSFAGATNGGRTLLLASQQLPVLLVGLWASPAAAGGYRLAHQLGRAIAKLPQLFARALFPELMRVQTQAGAEQFVPMLRRVLLFSAIGGAAIFAVLYFAGKPLLALIAGEEFLPAYPLLLLLGAAGVVEMLAVGFEPALIASNRAGLSFRLQLVVAIALVAMLILLVQMMGPIGAAVAILGASVLRFALMAAAVARSIRRHDPVHPLPAEAVEVIERSGRPDA